MGTRPPSRAHSWTSWRRVTSIAGASRCTGASTTTTALAEAEVEYEDHTSPSIWVTFKVVGGGTGEAAKIGSDVSAVIWTTTPWTIPHNRGLAFHPDFEYAVVRTEKREIAVGCGSVAALQADSEIKQAEVLGTYKGRELEGIKSSTRSCRSRCPDCLQSTSHWIRAAELCIPHPATARTTGFRHEVRIRGVCAAG